MSWTAKRYQRNWHHIPPQNPAAIPPIKKRVNKIDHAAYHQLFQNAGSFEQCVEILRWWWTINGKFIDVERNREGLKVA